MGQVKSSPKKRARFNSDSNSDIVKTMSGREDVTAFGNYQGNIIFMATSAVDKTVENGMNIIELGSANENGVLYDDFLFDHHLFSLFHSSHPVL